MTSFDKRVRRITLATYRITVAGATASKRNGSWLPDGFWRNLK